MAPLRNLLALALGCAAAAAWASPHSDALVRRGLAELQAHRYRDAIHFFSEAHKADPRDFHALLLHGAALNRLGEYQDALVLLSGLEARGGRHPEMDFEAGWALMGLSRARQCIERLERFDRSGTPRGQTAEFLGRCHLQLGNLDRAEQRFRQAVDREPRLKPAVDLQLARLERARNRADAARESLESAAASNTATGRALRDVLGRPEPLFQPEKPLQLSAALTAGHNDNVIGLGSTLPLPGDITRKSAYFARASLGAAYTRALDSRTSAVAGYALLADRYDGLSIANLDDHFLHADLLHAVDDTTAASFRLSHQHTRVSGSRFRDQSAVRAALARRFGESSATEVALAHSVADYHTPVASAAQKRNGTASELALAHRVRIPRSGWSGGIAATQTWNRAEGSDFNFDVRALSAHLGYEFAGRVTGMLGVSAARHDYSNPNSLAGAGFAFARKDKQAVYVARLSGPIDERLGWFAQVQNLRNDSNLSFYDFRQNVIGLGVTARF